MLMPKIGLFLDAGNVHSCDTCTVEKFLRDTFLMQECPSLVDCIHQVCEETYVVFLPKSRLTCEAVESIILKKNEQENVIDEQRMEIESLKARLIQSDKLRHESLETVNKLRAEFLHLVNQVTPRGNGIDSSRRRLELNGTQEPRSRRVLRFAPDSSRSVPKLWLTSLRK